MRVLRKINGPTQARRGLSEEIELIKKGLSEREVQLIQQQRAALRQAQGLQQAEGSGRGGMTRRHGDAGTRQVWLQMTNDELPKL